MSKRFSGSKPLMIIEMIVYALILVVFLYEFLPVGFE